MLTKEERNAIAERIGKEFDYTENGEFYEALIGEEIPDNTTWGTDCKVVRDRLIELCDTSNMIELPLGKDGQVIRVEDTVFNTDGEKLSVTSIRFSAGLGCIVICENDDSISTYAGKELTHNSPITTVYFAEKIREILKSDDDMNTWANSRLSDIADQLEKLGNSDD